MLLMKEATLGKSGFVFSHMNQLGHLSLTSCRAVSSDQLLALPVIRNQLLLLAQNRGATRQEQKIKRGGQPSEKAKNSKIRLAIINSRIKVAAIMSNLGTDPALLKTFFTWGPIRSALHARTARGSSWYLRPSQRSCTAQTKFLAPRCCKNNAPKVQLREKIAVMLQTGMV